MSVNAPLSVVLISPGGRMDITARLRTVSFREEAIGGYATATLSLDLPLSTDNLAFSQWATVKITDGRNGLVVWEGLLDDPGRGSSPTGQIWTFTARGPQTFTDDINAPYVYIDNPLGVMARRDNANPPSARDSVATDPTDGSTDAELLQLVPGVPLNSSSRVGVRYERFMATGQKVARFDTKFNFGCSLSTYAADMLARTDGVLASFETARTLASNSGSGGSSPRVIVTNWSNTRNTIDFRFKYTGAGETPGNDDRWCAYYDMVILGTRYNVAGTHMLTAASYTHSYVLASEVVADLLGRLLPKFDGPNAHIDTTAIQIDQLAFPGGATAREILDALLEIETGYRWGAYESNLDGEYRFEFVAWPTVWRYQAEVDDGFESEAAGLDVYDSVTVEYVDRRGAPQTLLRTQSVPLLTNAGRPRRGYVNLGEDVSSAVTAAAAGDRFLAEHSVVPNTGRLTVTRPVFDRLRGMSIPPWRIKPGELIRVRNATPPRGGQLTNDDRDGSSTFRIQAREYDATTGTATLELDTLSRSVARQVGQLAKR